MNKKTIALIVSLALCFGTAVTSCSSSDSSSGQSTVSSTESAAESTQAESTGDESSKAEPAADSTPAAESQPEESTADSQKDTDAPAGRKTNIIDGTDYLTFVSHGYKLPDDWEDKTEMVTFLNGQGYEVTVELRAYAAYQQLKEELEKEDIHIDVDTGYRSVAEQIELMQRYRERYGSDYVKKVVAVPGYSEHHTGLAIDLYLVVDGKDIIYNEDLVKYPEIWAKIHEKLAKYGFILHFAEGKEDITKFAYEPWHIRYVGEEPAKEITEQGLTLEEYLGITVPTDQDVYEEPMAPVNTETVYQVAMLQSLVQGFYEGILSVDALKEKGDTGIGTFDGVNGEMIVIDGEVYRANENGDVEKPEGDEMVPFSNVTFFDIDETAKLKDIKDMDTLKKAMTEYIEPNKNMFYMVKINAEFPYVKARSEPKQEKPYKMLDEALSETQKEFEFKDIKGTIVGLYCPDYMSGLNTPGWHFHFISEDRTKGGHVLGVSISEAEVQFDKTAGFKMYLYDSDEFQKLDLAKNVDEAIKSAETKSNDD